LGRRATGEVKGIGKVKQQQLAAIGFMKVIHLKNATINQLHDAASDAGNIFGLTYLSPS